MALVSTLQNYLVELDTTPHTPTPDLMKLPEFCFFLGQIFS